MSHHARNMVIAKAAIASKGDNAKQGIATAVANFPGAI